MAGLCEKKDSVSSLEDLCVRYVCKNINAITYVDPNASEARRWRFPCPNFYIIARPAQKILLQLCKRNALDDEKLTLFSSEFVDLISPIIKDVSISHSSLKVLRDFSLTSLSAMNLPSVNLNGIISCLGEGSVKSLVNLNATGTSVVGESNLLILVALGRFKNLQFLNVSRTVITTQCLQMVADDLPNLRHLNISRTRVKDISPLLAVRDRLTGLVMHRLELERREDTEKLLSVVVELHQLRILDVSDKPSYSVTRVDGIDRLCSAGTLPHIERMDFSGNQFCMKLEDAKRFIENHPKLNFVGFASWMSSSETEREGIRKLSLEHPGIYMLGDCGDHLLLNTLMRNKDRALYLQSALHNIFQATSNVDSLKPELLHAVLRVMRLHLRRMDMILAGTAVIYNLTRSEQGAQLPIDLLNRAVRMTLIAMEKFPNNRQLQKNCFLTLCSDTVLYRATFSCIQCCELVFNNLILFDDDHMKRMGVAIISILAAEISTSGLSDLAKNRRRLQCLLTYVAEKCLLQQDLVELGDGIPDYLRRVNLRVSGAPLFDTTLRFTLSALWNLTDECSAACFGFVEEGGLRIYDRVFKRFADQDEEMKNHVYTKCLGLLSNVAEDSRAKDSLLFDSVMDFILKMLRHPNIQISYFPAGIIAHLSCMKDSLWISALQSPKETYLKLLGESVCSWKPPQSEMVAYRSFKPFERLVLHPESRLEVRLWAVWAIHHILTRKETRYVPILRQCPYFLSFLRTVVNPDNPQFFYNGTQPEMSTSSRASSFSYFPNPSTHTPDEAVATEDTDMPIPQPRAYWLSAGVTQLDVIDRVIPAGDHIPYGGQITADPMPVHSRGSIARDEPVLQTTVGLKASAEPDESQLACERLLRNLATEILVAVDRVPTASTAGENGTAAF